MLYDNDTRLLRNDDDEHDEPQLLHDDELEYVMIYHDLWSGMLHDDDHDEIKIHYDIVDDNDDDDIDECDNDAEVKIVIMIDELQLHIEVDDDDHDGHLDIEHMNDHELNDANELYI